MEESIAAAQDKLYSEADTKSGKPFLGHFHVKIFLFYYLKFEKYFGLYSSLKQTTG